MLEKTMKKNNEKKPSLLKKLAEKQIIVFTALFWIINIIIWYIATNCRFFIPARFKYLFNINYTVQDFVMTIIYIIYGLLILFFVYKVDTVNDIGFYSAKGISKSLLLGLPIISFWIYDALAYASIWRVRILPKWYQIALALILPLTIGFAEELAFRGVLLPVLLKSWKHKKHGVAYAVLLSSFIFGSMHCIQHIVFHNPLLMAIFHVTTTTIFGMLMAVVLLHTRNIWGVIILHALSDLFYVLANHVFPQGYDMSATKEVNKLLGTSFEVRGRTDWIILLILHLPILVAAIIYLRKALKNQDGWYGVMQEPKKRG